MASPVIADPFHRMKYMERHGSGLRKIVRETEKPPGYTAAYNPKIFSTATDFRCEATLCHPHRRRFEISRNSDGGDALVATRRSNARRDDALSLPCLMPGILPDMRQGHDVKP